MNTKLKLICILELKHGEKGKATSENISVKGKIEWILKKYKITERFKIKQYHIYERKG